MSKRAGKKGAAAGTTPRHDAPAPPRATGRHRGPPAAGASRLVRNLLLLLLPAALVWVLLTPYYNRFLLVAGENLCRLMESPDVTDLVAHGHHYALILRLDFPPATARVYSFRVTDLHFHLVLLAALFLAVPGVPARLRWSRLGGALLLSVFFHLALVFFWVRFAYATQLGSFSIEHYSAFARETLGLAKHLLDLPFKLAWPLLLWSAFYLRALTGEASGS